MTNNDDFFNKILKNTKAADTNIFLLANMDAIKKALSLNIPVSKIYETFTTESNIKISYQAFLNKVKKFKNIETTDIITAECKNTVKTPYIPSPVLSEPNLDDKVPQSNLNEPMIIKSSQKKFEYKSDKTR